MKKKIVFIISISLLSLFLIEVTLRNILPDFVSTIEFDRNKGYSYKKYLNKRFSYNDTQINFKTNGFGYRDDEWENKISIAVIGDSIVAALGNHKHKRFTEILEKKIKSNGTNLQVLNMGVNGQNVVNFINSVNFVKNQQNPQKILLFLSTTDDFHFDEFRTIHKRKLYKYYLRNNDVVSIQSDLNSYELIKRIMIESTKKMVLGDVILTSISNLKKTIFNESKKKIESNLELKGNKLCSTSVFIPENRLKVLESLLLEVNKIDENISFILSPARENFFESALKCDKKKNVIIWFDEFIQKENLRGVNLINFLRNENPSKLFLDGAHYNDLLHSKIADIIYEEIIDSNY